MLDDNNAPQTFESFLRIKHGGNVAAFGKLHGLSVEHCRSLRALLGGQRSMEMSKAVITLVSEAMGVPPEESFPQERYQRRIFAKLKDTPGFRMLSEKFGVQYYSEKHSLHQLLKEKGMSETDIRRFQNILLGNFSAQSNASFCCKIAKSLDFSVQELFPVAQYGFIVNGIAEHSKGQRKNSSLTNMAHLSAVAEAQWKVMNATAPEPQPEKGQIEDRVVQPRDVERVLSGLSAFQRRIVYQHFIDGKTYKELAHVRKLSVGDIFREIRSALKAIRNSLTAEQEKELLAKLPTGRSPVDGVII